MGRPANTENPDGHIVVEARPEGDADVLVAVEDRGPGIAAVALEDLF